MTKLAAVRFFKLAVILLLATVVSAEGSTAKPFTTMFSLYEGNRQQGIGNYITEDFILLGHSLMMSETLAAVEENVLSQELTAFTGEMQRELGLQPESTVKQRNIRYFLVLDALLKGVPSTEIKDTVVAGEVGKIVAASGILPSGLTGYPIDYSRFKPRGRYTRSPEMERWFRAMTWTGSVYFPLLSSKATEVTPEMADEVTSCALMLARLIDRSETLSAKYKGIDSLLGRVFGKVEDLVWNDYLDIVEETDDVAAFRKNLHKAARDNGKIGRIYDGIVMVDQLEEGVTAGDVLCGMRLFPRRYSPDSGAMQRMVYPDVAAYTGDKAKLPFTATTAGTEVVKGFPRAYELMWLLGSGVAGEKLVEEGDKQYEGYGAALENARLELANPSNLAVNCSTIRYWLSMGSVTDEARRLNSMLGYWTWGRYISLLFTKQSVTGAVKSIRIPKERGNAWLEPAVELYIRLQADTLELRNALAGTSGEVVENLDDYLNLMAKLIHIADLERSGYSLDNEQNRLLNDLDKTLSSLTGVEDKPIVVDVHTEPNSGMVVQEGVGFAKPTEFVLGNDRLRGALFTHYEFKQPMAERLTDESWIKMLLKK